MFPSQDTSNHSRPQDSPSTSLDSPNGDRFGLHGEMLALLDELKIQQDLEALAGKGFHLTDLGNAERLVDRFSIVIRYVQAWGWLIWDGRRWVRDEMGEIISMAVETMRGIYREAAQEQDKNRRRALAEHARRSEGRSRLEATIALAQHMVPARVGDFDADPWLLNCENGILDLRTGKLKPHRIDRFLTKMAPVVYNPEAQCPTWMAFLDKIMAGDSELIAFLQRAVGYTLTGDASEQVLFFLYGTGANGKSTFLNAILALLGQGYARQAAPDLLIVKQGEVHPTGLADLFGTRFVASIEVEEGRRLAEVLVKQMTGGDKLKARFMRQDFFEFDPSFKIFLAANHKPIVRGTDHAIWRRIRLIPFEVTIPPGEQDKALAGKLHRELPGTLRWAVEGCLAWQREGLGEPVKVRKATENYRAEMDLIGGFLEDCCLIERNAQAKAKDLYEVYCTWCERNGEPPVGKMAFGQRLQERGFEQIRIGKNRDRGWRGIGVVEIKKADVADKADVISGINSRNIGNGNTKGKIVSATSATSAIEEQTAQITPCFRCGRIAWRQEVGGDWYCVACQPKLKEG